MPPRILSVSYPSHNPIGNVPTLSPANTQTSSGFAGLYLTVIGVPSGTSFISRRASP